MKRTHPGSDFPIRRSPVALSCCPDSAPSPVIRWLTHLEGPAVSTRWWTEPASTLLKNSFTEASLDMSTLDVRTELPPISALHKGRGVDNGWGGTSVVKKRSAHFLVYDGPCSFRPVVLSPWPGQAWLSLVR